MKRFWGVISALAVFAVCTGADYTDKIMDLRRANVNQPIKPSVFKKLVSPASAEQPTQ